MFFSTSGIHLIDFVPEGVKINSDYFCGVLDRLDRALPYQRQGTVWLHMDNAKPHRAKKTQNKLKELGFSETPHPPYSPDLAPSDFWLFGRLKGSLEGQEFHDRNTLEAAIQAQL